MRFFKKIESNGLTTVEIKFGKTIYQLEDNALTFNGRDIRFDMDNPYISQKQFAKYGECMKKLEKVVQLSHDRNYETNAEYMDHFVSLLKDNDFIQYERVDVTIPTELQKDGQGQFMYVNRLVGQTDCTFVVNKNEQIEVVLFSDEKYTVPSLMMRLGYGRVKAWKDEYTIYNLEKI